MELSFLTLVAAFGLGFWAGFGLPFRASWLLSALVLVAGLAIGVLTRMGIGLPDGGELWLTVAPGVLLFVIGQGLGALKRREGGPL
ncbi:hypothetical protein [Oceaniglobus trochenteri]|uniref:hypothetical protein n=1 Tax=Oceaniglobus trochenteri TaxID=2763260 RepID=UPI001CFFF076|nr:hypothetical protein [Oceaniglobus trochenteri]